MPVSPTTEGFRAAFRRPSLTLAEIAWRWTAGATAAALVAFGLVEYLDTLPVTNGELLFLHSGQPYLIGQAIAHILRGSLNRVVMAGLLAVLLLAGLWILAASLGRIATVRGLLDYFHDSLHRVVAGYVSPRGLLPALLRLNFLRAAVALAAVLGLLGVSILAGFASRDANPRPALAFFIFLPLAGLICTVWSTLNWLLSLAGMLAVRDCEEAAGAIAAAVVFCSERSGAVFAVSAWTGLAHVVAFVGACTMASMPLGFVAIVPWRLVVAVVIVVMLAYFALVDWIYMARLAGYVCITETPQASLMQLPPQPKPAPPVRTSPVRTSLDRDELILSDVPNLAAQT